MKRILFSRLTIMFIFLASLLLVSCNSINENEHTANTFNVKDPILSSSAATGFPTGEIQRPQIMFHGTIFYYDASGFDLPLPDGFAKVGTVISVDNQKAPTINLTGARVAIGQSVFANPSIPNILYLSYENGFAKFEAK